MGVSGVECEGVNEHLLNLYYVLGIILGTLSMLFPLVLTSAFVMAQYETHFTLKLRESRWLAQGHSAKKGQSWDQIHL